jgi:serine/threonine protein kinase
VVFFFRFFHETQKMVNPFLRPSHRPHQPHHHHPHAEHHKRSSSSFHRYDNLTPTSPTSKRGNLVGHTIGGYEFVRYIASGTFGDVYEARAPGVGGTVAVKLQSGDRTMVSKSQRAMEQEVSVLKLIAAHPSDIPFAPKFFEEVHLNWRRGVVMSLLDTQVRVGKGGVHSMPHALLALQALHDMGYVHRDVKPDNMLMSSKDPEPFVYLIDFGLARPISRTDSRHDGRSRSFVGTTRFASVASHMGKPQGPRDDLESLGFVALYLARGRLPWQGKGMERDEIGQIKRNTSLRKLCADRCEPLIDYFKIVRRTRTTERPDYDALHRILSEFARSVA